ncbi:DNA helicase RecQ [uncultured Oscillibacter sp.]|uniref:DNA helicase RecQ n=1 Tax=uncultured Oscillibacter sp. TaxID=876091 RepID=UPI0025FCE124|nr:DNA helicase RecQ [uncultured Oscillibacter sp.]
MDKLTLLKQHFGHSGFRPGQEPLADALLSGRDALGVMPTGAGKSVCYQLPALLLPGTALVISPLISLMKDQVAALTQAGIPAAFLNSSQDAGEYREACRQIRRGDCKLLYAAPERLQAESFRRLLEGLSVSLVAVDEAHCVSQWGQDFRPSYLDIAGLVASLPVRPPVGAFTATATAAVRRDIETLLDLRDPLRITTGFDRPNLFFEVDRPKDKDLWLRRFLAERPGQSGIVYCATRKTVDAVTASLLAQGVPAARYHAGMEDGERRRSQEAFVYDQVRVMVATNAFGMGIDKSNVSFVVHYNMPKDLESYYQEAGRAGRDGGPARCVLLYAPGDVRTAKFLIANSQETQEGDPDRLRRDLSRLDRMVRYCRTGGCLRADILDYFGEIHGGRCGRCGNCAGSFVDRDITVEAQKILSAVARVEKRYAYGLGAAVIIKLLRGSRDKRVLQLGLDQLPTHGALKGVDQDRIQRYIDALMEKGYLVTEGEEYPVLRLTAQAGDVLFRGKKVLFREPAPQAEEAKARPLSPAASAEEEDGLLAALKSLRFRLAQEAGVPAYVIFSNATLADMAALRPLTMEEFLQVSGVGRVKAERYGAAFLQAVQDWRAGLRA